MGHTQGTADMEKRLTLELRGRLAHKVKELDLDGVKCGGEIDFGDYDFSALEVLTISEAGLTSLKNFPTLPNLLRLDLCKNRISKGLEKITECKKLTHLMLTENRLKPTPELEVLDPLVSLPNLTHLELGEKFFPVEDDKMEEMRKIIFQKLPTLRYLEGTDIDNKDEDDDRENEDDEDEEDEEDEDEDEDDHGFENGIAGDDVLDGDDDLEEEEEGDSDEEADERIHFNGEVNGTLEDFNDQSSDAEDEQEDEDDDDDDDDDNRPGSGGKTGGKVVRGKKRKFEDDGIP